MFFLLVFITACAGNVPHDSGQSSDLLMQQFNDYKLLRTTEDESAYFTPDLWAAIKKARFNKEQSIFTKIFSQFPNEIIQVSSHKESIQGGDGCLMISGVNSEDTPMSYFINYKLKGEYWLIEKFNADYSFDGLEQYPVKAICDAEERNRLWLEHVEAIEKTQ